MKRFILINLAVASLGLLVGLFVWGLLKIKPIDQTEYNIFAYYLNQNNKIEQTMLSKKKDDVVILIDYYNERENKPSSQIVLAKDNGSFFIIPLGSKVKIIDTIDVNVAKIQLLYKTKYGDFDLVKGYIPLINLHKGLPTNNKNQ
jgi:hypothetical protein